MIGMPANIDESSGKGGGRIPKPPGDPAVLLWGNRAVCSIVLLLE